MSLSFHLGLKPYWPGHSTQIHWLDYNSCCITVEEELYNFNFIPPCFQTLHRFLLWELSSCLSAGYWPELLWWQWVLPVRFTYRHWLTSLQLRKASLEHLQGTWIKIIMELPLQSDRSKMTENATIKASSTRLFRCQSFLCFFFFSSLCTPNDSLRIILRNQIAPIDSSYLLLTDQFNSSCWKDDS